MNFVNVCIACDNNYAKYAGVVITSVLYNADRNTFLNFYILDGGISDKLKEQILSLKSLKDCNINFIKINNDDFDEYRKVQTHKYITLATYYRLKLPTILSNIDRVIYLDCDTVVNTDLAPLFNTNMQTNSFAGSHDTNREAVRANPTYVNAGVLVMDLKNMREDNLEQRFLDWTREHIDSITCGDQEIINEVCKGKISVVHDRWNVQTSDFMNRSSYIRKPNIIHYIAKNKPWNKISLCYFKNYYIKYLQLSPWKKNPVQEFSYRYIEQILSIFSFVIHRPTFLFMKKFYESVYNTYFNNCNDANHDKEENIKNEEIKISFITASYNYGKYIKSTIESVQRQTIKDWEMIIVDDGSDDDSVDIINQYCKLDSRIKLFRHSDGINKGLTETIKLGISKASGNWIVFLESDDTIVPDYLETKLNIIKNFPNISFIFNDINFVGESGTISNTSNFYYERLHKILENKIYPYDFRKELEKRNIVPTFSAVMLRKSVLDDTSFDCVVPQWTDYNLWSQIAKNHSFYYVDKKLTNWRMHSDSYINDSIDKKNELFFKKVQLPENLYGCKNTFLQKLNFHYLYIRKNLLSFCVKRRELTFLGKYYKF